MKFVFLIDVDSPYGAESVAKSHFDQAVKDGHDCCLYVLKISKSAQTDGIDGRRMHELGNDTGFLAAVRKVFMLRRILRRHRPDAIFAYLTFPNVIALLARPRGCRVVASEHGFPDSSRRNFRAMLLLARRCYQRVDLLWTPSRGLAAEVSKVFGVDSSKVSVLPIPMAHFSEKVSFSRSSGRLFGLPINLLFVGRLDENKRPHLAIKLLRQPTMEQATLTIIGDGILRTAMEELVQHEGLTNRVTFLGAVNNPLPYFNPDMILIHPSRREGFGIVLLEAASCGIPVVTLASGGPRELVPDIVPGVCLRSDASLAEIAQAVNHVHRAATNSTHENLEQFRPSNAWKALYLECEKTLWVG